MREDTEQHGHHHREPDGGLAGLMRLFLQIDQAEHDGGEAARAEPAHEQHRGPAESGANQRNRHRQHAHEGETEDRISRMQPVELWPRPRHQQAKEEKHREVEQLSPFLGEFDAVFGRVLETQLHREARDERRNEHAGAGLFGGEQAEHRHGHHAELHPRMRHPIPPVGETQQPAAQPPIPRPTSVP